MAYTASSLAKESYVNVNIVCTACVCFSTTIQTMFTEYLATAIVCINTGEVDLIVDESCMTKNGVVYVLHSCVEIVHFYYCNFAPTAISVQKDLEVAVSYIFLHTMF